MVVADIVGLKDPPVFTNVPLVAASYQFKTVPPVADKAAKFAPQLVAPLVVTAVDTEGVIAIGVEIAEFTPQVTIH